MPFVPLGLTPLIGVLDAGTAFGDEEGVEENPE
jgi:hypothetical protein